MPSWKRCKEFVPPGARGGSRSNEFSTYSILTSAFPGRCIISRGCTHCGETTCNAVQGIARGGACNLQRRQAFPGGRGPTGARPPDRQTDVTPGGLAVSLAAGAEEAGNTGLFGEKRDRQVPLFWWRCRSQVAVSLPGGHSHDPRPCPGAVHQLVGLPHAVAKPCDRVSGDAMATNPYWDHHRQEIKHLLCPRRGRQPRG
jgi:hypothetical protein